MQNGNITTRVVTKGYEHALVRKIYMRELKYT